MLPTKLQRGLEIPTSFLSKNIKLLNLSVHQKASTTSLLAITQLHAVMVILMVLNSMICSEATPTTTAMDSTTSRQIAINLVGLTTEESITYLVKGMSITLSTGPIDSMFMFGISSTLPLTMSNILSTSPWMPLMILRMA